MSVRYETDGPVAVVTLDRPQARNAVDGPTAAALADAFGKFDADPALAVAVLTGAGGTFCAGADLKAFGTPEQNRLEPIGDGPMGPTRLLLSKPVLATGRPVNGEEALGMGLANRLVEPGQALPAAIALARELAALPQRCLRSVWLSAHEQTGLPMPQAMAQEFQRGLGVIGTGETAAGAARFAAGAGRHGSVPERHERG